MNNEDADRMGNVWQVDPIDAHKFQQARMGDHLMVAFECVLLCVFRKLYRCNPILMDEEAVDAFITPLEVFQEQNGYYPTLSWENDRKATATIRWIILDAFWSHASLTVRANTKVIQRGCEYQLASWAWNHLILNKFGPLWLWSGHPDDVGITGTRSLLFMIQAIQHDQAVQDGQRQPD
jgi:hypothetical protein